MDKLNKIFNLQNGNKFNLNKMIICEEDAENGVCFVNRTGRNNGVTAIVEKKEEVEPFSEGNITVALGGSILSSFVQTKPFYTGQNVAILTPINPDMTIQEKLYYCEAIYINKFRFSTFGREANRFLKDIIVPSPNEVPNWVNEIPVNSYLNKIEDIFKGI